MQSTLDAAIAAGKAGHKVFPVIENGKIPAVGGWQQKATTDEAKIRAMWTDKDPVLGDRIKNYNIGISTEGLLVLDVDNKNGKKGDTALEELDLFHGVPKTFEVTTPTGGRHLYFAPEASVANSAGRLGLGLDVRGDGGYVVGPGSVIDGKMYEGNLYPMAEAPKWLEEAAGRPAPRSDKGKVVELLDTAGAVQRARKFLEDAEPATEGQGGDAHTFKIAAKIKDLGVSELTALELMDEVWNPRCSPPWDFEHLATKVSNAYHYGKRPVGEKAPEADFEATSDDFPVEKAADKPRSPIVHWPDNDDAPEPDPLIDGIMDKGSCVILYGKPNVGKTFVAYTMARHIAAGDKFAERDVEQGAVLYVQAEGHSGVRRRRKALKKYFKDANIPFSIVKASVNLVKSAADRQWLADTIKATQDFYDVPVVLVVIDTLSASAPGMDENAAGDVSGALAAMKSFTCDAGITLMLVHHEGKNGNGGPRGSSAFVGNVDTVIHCVDGNIVSDKARESAKLEPIPYSLEVLDVGTTAKGRKVTSCVAKVYGPSARDFGGIPMTEAERQALDCLALLAAETEGDVGVTYSAWKKAYMDVRKGNNSCPSPDTVRKALDRAGQGLRTKGYVRNDLKDQWFIVPRT